MQGLGLDLGLQKSGLSLQSLDLSLRKSREAFAFGCGEVGKRTTRRLRVAEFRGENAAFLRVLRDSAFSIGGLQDAGMGFRPKLNPGHSLVLPEYQVGHSNYAKYFEENSPVFIGGLAILGAAGA